MNRIHNHMSPTAPPLIHSPNWFASASQSLKLIQDNLAMYENDERVAPSNAILENVRIFLETLKDKTAGHINLSEPKLFVSPNGDIVTTFGDRPQVLNVRFGNSTTFLFIHPTLGTVKGTEICDAIVLTINHFQTI